MSVRCPSWRMLLPVAVLGLSACSAFSPVRSVDAGAAINGVDRGAIAADRVLA